MATGLSSHRVLLVVRRVVGAVLLVQHLQPRDRVVDRRARRQVEQHRLDLGAQEVVGAARAERREPRAVRRGEELEHARVVGEVPDHRAVVRRDARGSSGRAPPPSPGARPASARRSSRPRGRTGSSSRASSMYACAVSMIQREFFSASALVAPHAVMPWPPRMHPIASGFFSLIAAMSRPSWKPGRRHGTQTHADRRRPSRSASRRPWPSRTRCRRRGAGGRRASRRRERAWRCRSTALRRRNRAGSSRTRRPSRLALDAGVDVRRARARGRGAARRARARSGCRGRRPSPSPRAARPGSPVTGSVSVQVVVGVEPRVEVE